VSNRIYISHLPLGDVRRLESVLGEVLSAVGQVVSLDLDLPEEVGGAERVAFAEMGTAEEARAVVLMLDGARAEGCPINVGFAEPRMTIAPIIPSSLCQALPSTGATKR
jgi:hypothetical protein